MFGGRLPTETLGRLWSMLAHRQGGAMNASELARSLGVSAQTPFHANVGKRLVRSPKTYIRDSGLLHALLDIPTMIKLAGHPVIGASWEGFVIEQLIGVLPDLVRPYFYRTAGGGEIDLLLEFGDEQLWAIEIKRQLANTSRGFHEACQDLAVSRKILIHGGTDCFPMHHELEAVSLTAAIEMMNQTKTTPHPQLG